MRTLFFGGLGSFAALWAMLYFGVPLYSGGWPNLMVYVVLLAMAFSAAVTGFGGLAYQARHRDGP